MNLEIIYNRHFIHSTPNYWHFLFIYQALPSQWHRQSEQSSQGGTGRTDSSGREATETQLWMTSGYNEKSYYGNVKRNHTLGEILELQNKCTYGLYIFLFKHI